MPSASLMMSVWDHLLLDHGSTYLRLCVKFTVSSSLCTNFRMFHGRSLWLERTERSATSIRATIEIESQIYRLEKNLGGEKTHTHMRS